MSSIYPLFLNGWEDTSTWGDDDDYLYAQLTRNGVPDTNGPEYWITPPHYPAARTTTELAQLIANVTTADAPTVLRGMAFGAKVAGASDSELRGLGLPEMD
jgi:hypothetical protein